MSDKKRILIVEDEDVMRRMICLDLSAAGYEVAETKDGVEGLEMVKKFLPDLIITDVLMPRMDGFQFYKALKEDPITSDIPVFILTARGKMEESFRVMGVDEFISKPFKSEELLEKIANVSVSEKPKPAGAISKRVLVAGEDSNVIENMVLQLKKKDCHTDLVTTGPQVISKVVMFLPNILVLDVLMDGMPAHDIVTVIRQMPQGEKIPILLYSFYRLDMLGSEDVRQRALSIDSEEKACLEAGATAYLGRFNESVFLKQMEKYL